MISNAFELGPFWRTLARSNLANMTLPIAISEFFIISPVKQSSTLETVFSVGKSFDDMAWFAIIAMIAYAGVILHIVTRHHASEKERINGPCSCLTRSLHICYVTVRSFVASDSVESTENPSKVEKIVVIGFVIFSVLIITAYTSTAAAFMVLERSPTVYNSLGDFLSDQDARACTYGASVSDIGFEYSELSGRLFGLSGGSTDLIDSLGTSYDDQTCNIILLPSTDYEILVTQNEVYCKTTKILTDDISVTIDNVIMVNPHLEYVDELVKWMNDYIENGLYEYITNVYYNSMKNFDFDISLVAMEMENNITRNLRSSAAISSSSTEILDPFCSNDDINDSEPTLSVTELTFPLMLTFLCSTLGLISFYIGRCSCYPQKRNKIIVDTDDDESSLRAMIMSMPIKDIYSKLLHIDSVSKCDIHEALESLPNKSRLVDLLLKINRSCYTAELRSLSTLNTGELVDVLFEAEHLQTLEQKVPLVWESALNDSEPREKLIETIFVDDFLKEFALQRATEKKTAPKYDDNSGNKKIE